MRIFTVIGARPQFIKAAPLSAALRQRHQEFLVHTGQHYDDQMSRVFFEELSIPAPDVHLNAGSGTHAEHLAAMIVPLERLMTEQQPDWVLVYGDTNSTLAGALAAAKLNLPVAHVEAGLRSFNRTMPEEINRVLTDHLAARLFCPTQVAVDNLAREGITQGVLITGDIMVDAVLRYVETARQRSTLRQQLALGDAYALVTIHRPANADDPVALRAILDGLNRLEMPVVFPVHPRTRRLLSSLDLAPAAQVHLIEPVGYLDMLALLDGAAVALTDSGGLQKEAYVLRTPCVTIRTETEWVETVESGWNMLCAPEAAAVIRAARHMMTHTPDAHPDFYGDGRAAARMLAAL